MTVLGIDPGSEQSAYVLWDGVRVLEHGKVPNSRLVLMLLTRAFPLANFAVVEQIASYGMAVGAEVFETVFWSGRFVQAVLDTPNGTLPDRMPRKDVKLHLCGSMKAKDSNIRQALIDRFGGKDRAIGRKALPGPLYGIKADCWAALALCVTWFDQHAQAARETA